MKINIQCVTHGLVFNKSKILVYKVEDEIKRKSFFRLIGGHINFGESAPDALKREFKEEINQEIKIIQKLDVFESIFVYKGNNQHEFVSLFKIEFSNEDMYKKNNIIGHEGPHRTFNAQWVETCEFENKKKILYPPHILNYLSK